MLHIIYFPRLYLPTIRDPKYWMSIPWSLSNGPHQCHHQPTNHQASNGGCYRDQSQPPVHFYTPYPTQPYQGPLRPCNVPCPLPGSSRWVKHGTTRRLADRPCDWPRCAICSHLLPRHIALRAVGFLLWRLCAERKAKVW